MLNWHGQQWTIFPIWYISLTILSSDRSATLNLSCWWDAQSNIPFISIDTDSIHGISQIIVYIPIVCTWLNNSMALRQVLDCRIPLIFTRIWISLYSYLPLQIHDVMCIHRGNSINISIHFRCCVKYSDGILSWIDK